LLVLPRLASQPFVVTPSQLANPLLQLPMPHTPAGHVSFAFAKLHTFPHALQLVADVCVFVSQPLAATESQLPKPALQLVTTQLPAEHASPGFRFRAPGPRERRRDGRMSGRRTSATGTFVGEDPLPRRSSPTLEREADVMVPAYCDASRASAPAPSALSICTRRAVNESICRASALMRWTSTASAAFSRCCASMARRCASISRCCAST
jgi:hypothetical protein